MDREREKMVLEKLREEERGIVMMTGFIRERVYEFLVREKGYLEEDIEIDAPFEVETSTQRERCSVDFIVRAGGKRIVAIKCAVSALESIERHVLAFSRVVEKNVMIPFSVVTRSDHSRVMRTENGELVSEDLAAIPDKSAATLIAGSWLAALPPERAEKERRILLAFNGLDCGVPGACGPGAAGVQQKKKTSGQIIPLKFNRPA